MNRHRLGIFWTPLLAIFTLLMLAPKAAAFEHATTYTITAHKFYDLNANGVREPNDLPIWGWKFVVTGPENPAPDFTDMNGSVTFTVSTPGTYTLTEIMPPGFWVNSTPTSCIVEVNSNNPSAECTFGNYCLEPSGGFTPGFWSNKNGAAKFNDHKGILLVNASCKSNATGTQPDFPDYAAFRAWLLGASANNMAYMLSVHMMATKLSLAAGYINGNAFDICSGMTVAELVEAANTELCLHPTAFPRDPWRSYQERLKDCLTAINENGGVVVPKICPIIYP